MSLAENHLSVIRLLLKISGYIGPAASRWMSAVCSREPLNSLELEILERTFSMGLYPDELLEQSCRTALGEQIFSISKFPFFVEEVQNRMYN